MFWKEVWTIVNTIQDLENVFSYNSSQKGGLKEWEKEAVLLAFLKKKKSAVGRLDSWILNILINHLSIDMHLHSSFSNRDVNIPR